LNFWNRPWKNLNFLGDNFFLEIEVSKTKAVNRPFLKFQHFKEEKISCNKSLKHFPKKKIDFQEIKISQKINVFFVFF
jgi:hypothetical protein